jgi:hypothetical protein
VIHVIYRGRSKGGYRLDSRRLSIVSESVLDAPESRPAGWHRQQTWKEFGDGVD